MFNCATEQYTNTKDNINQSITSDLTSSINTDFDTSCKGFGDKKFLVELNDVFKCTLCEAVLVGDVSVCKHLKRFNHKTREKIFEEKEAESKSSAHSTENDSNENTNLDKAFLHSSPKQSREQLNTYDSIKETIHNISYKFENLCSNLSNISNSCNTCNQIFNSTELLEQHVECSDHKCKNDAVSISLTNDELNEKIKSELELCSISSFHGTLQNVLSTSQNENSCQEIVAMSSSSEIQLSLSTIEEESSSEDDDMKNSTESVESKALSSSISTETQEIDQKCNLDPVNNDAIQNDNNVHDKKEHVTLDESTAPLLSSATEKDALSDLHNSDQSVNTSIIVESNEPQNKVFTCNNCNFKFPSQNELSEHIEIEPCVASESCESDIDVETVKKLVKFNTHSPKLKFKSQKTVISKLFPQPQCKENYIKRFLKNEAENVFKRNPEKLIALKKSLELCYVTDKQIRCMICNETCDNDPQVYYDHFRSEKHVANYNLTVQVNQMFGDKKSFLNLAKNYLFHITRNGLQCVCCKITFGNYMNKILGHTNSKNHKSNVLLSENRMKILQDKLMEQLNDIWYNIERYWCEPCDIKFFHEIHFSNHLETWNHKQHVANGRFVFDICIPCGSLWLGLPITYDIHSQILIHKYMLDHKLYEVHTIPEPVISLLKGFDGNMEILLDDTNNAISKFSNSQNELIKSIDELLRPHFPEIKIQFFGSRITGVCCSKGAVDINLTFGYTNVISENCFLTEVQNYFLEKPEIWEMECVIIRENVPVIHLFHINTKLKCNISIGGELSVEKTQIIKSFIELYPSSKAIIIFLKRWFFLCELWYSKGISTFTIVWLVIFYLQKRWNLPNIYQLMQQRHMSNYRYDQNYIFNINKRTDLKNVSVKQLLIECFKFFATYNYKELIICPLLGNDVKKEVFITGKNVPQEMLFNHSAEGFSDSFHIETPLCLQDPVECKLNITKNVSKLTIRELKSYCAQSANILENN